MSILYVLQSTENPKVFNVATFVTKAGMNECLVKGRKFRIYRMFFIDRIFGGD